MRDTYLVGRNFSFLGTSPFLRALETAKITVPDGAWNEFPLLAPRLHQAWDTLFSTRDPTPTTLQQIEELWPRLVDVEAEWIYEGATRALNFLEEGEHALLVSHQPLIGLLRGQFDPRFGLYDQTLEKGGIYKITVRDDGPSMSEEINPPT
jgi:broad specificity phosphatase PhoE